MKVTYFFGSITIIAFLLSIYFIYVSQKQGGEITNKLESIQTDVLSIKKDVAGIPTKIKDKFEIPIEYKKNKAIVSELRIAEGYFYKANKYISSKKYGKGLEYYNKSIALFPNISNVWLNKGNVLNLLGRDGEAMDAYNKALELDPNDSGIYFNKAKLLNELARYSDALEVIDESIKLSPLDDAWLVKGNIYYNMGDLDNSLACFEQALKINPENEIVFNNKGCILADQGDHIKAIKYFDKATLIDPNMCCEKGDVYSNKGSSLLALKKYKEALTAYEKAAELNPIYAKIWSQMGVTLFSLGRINESIQKYNRALTLDQNYYYAYFNKGVSLYYLGKSHWKEALDNINKALEINPNYIEAKKARKELIEKSKEKS